MVTPELAEVRPFIAGEVNYTDGPFENPERYLRFNLFGKVPLNLPGGNRITMTGTSYGGGWFGSGQVPLREVTASRLDRFGTVDPTEGGNTQRHSIYARYESPSSEAGHFTVLAYLVHYRFNLYSNFTFFSGDPEFGDQIEQTDVRTYAGADTRYSFTRSAFGFDFDTEVGVQVRNDVIENTLNHDFTRERLATIVDAEVGEGALGIFVEEEVSLPPWARLVIGLRGDGFGFQVRDHLEDTTSTAGATSGVAFVGTPSPKASLILTWPEVVEVYLNSGVGFHSNDARGVVRGKDPVTPVTRAYGYEVGARSKILGYVDLAGSLFGLNLDQESVWVGDEGTTELRGSTLRLGAEGEARAKLYFDWLYADANLTWTNAAFTGNAGNGDAVALAPTLIVDGGVSLMGLGGFFGRLGGVYIADRPATEDRFITAQGFFRVDGSVGYKNDIVMLSLDVQNVLNTQWREAQFANVSRLPSETSPSDCPTGTRAVGEGDGFEGCEDLHFTPGAPFNGRLEATFFF